MDFYKGLLAWFIAAIFLVYAFSLSTAAAVFSGVLQTSLHLSAIQTNSAIGAFIIVVIAFFHDDINISVIFCKRNPWQARSLSKVIQTF